jgi:rod shape-determining protein MreD
MSLRRRDIFYYSMIPLLFAAALVQSSMLVRVEVGNVKPDLVLLLVLVGTLIFGGPRGIVWAFIGGIALDLFSGGPMGSSSLALIAAAVVAAPGHHTLSRYNLVVPVGVALAGTFVYGVTYVAVLNAVSVLAGVPFLSRLGFEEIEIALPFVAMLQYVVLPSMAYNGLIMLLLTPLLNRVPESQDVGI